MATQIPVSPLRTVDSALSVASTPAGASSVQSLEDGCQSPLFIGSRVRVLLGANGQEWILLLHHDDGNRTWQTHQWNNAILYSIPPAVTKQFLGGHCSTNHGRYCRQVEFGPTYNGAWFIQSQKMVPSSDNSSMDNNNDDRNSASSVSSCGSGSVIMDEDKDVQSWWKGLPVSTYTKVKEVLSNSSPNSDWRVSFGTRNESFSICLYNVNIEDNSKQDYYCENVEDQLVESLKRCYCPEADANNTDHQQALDRRPVRCVRLFNDGGYFIHHGRDELEYGGSIPACCAEELKDLGNRVCDVAIAVDGTWIIITKNSFVASHLIDEKLSTEIGKFFSWQRRKKYDDLPGEGGNNKKLPELTSNDRWPLIGESPSHESHDSASDRLTKDTALWDWDPPAPPDAAAIQRQQDALARTAKTVWGYADTTTGSATPSSVVDMLSTSRDVPSDWEKEAEKVLEQDTPEIQSNHTHTPTKNVAAKTHAAAAAHFDLTMTTLYHTLEEQIFQEKQSIEELDKHVKAMGKVLENRRQTLCESLDALPRDRRNQLLVRMANAARAGTAATNKALCPNGNKLQDPCFVCRKVDATNAVLPCGHKCLCEKCASIIVSWPPQTRLCPICRKPLQSTLKVLAQSNP